MRLFGGRRLAALIEGGSWGIGVARAGAARACTRKLCSSLR